MPTDNTIATAVFTGRQEGFFVSPSARAKIGSVGKESDPLRAAETEASTDRQDLSVPEQELPPGRKPEDEQALEKAVSDINSYVQNLQRDLQFKVDTELGRTIVSVIDSETKEVIRQIPSEDAIERARFLEEQLSSESHPDGLLLQVKV
jgi:flagellar protein FlaG